MAGRPVAGWTKKLVIVLDFGWPSGSRCDNRPVFTVGLTAQGRLFPQPAKLVNLAIGIYYRRRVSGNTEEFCVSGRNVSSWLAGTSMVATTFAADTPLFVAEWLLVFGQWTQGVLQLALVCRRRICDLLGPLAPSSSLQGQMPRVRMALATRSIARM